MLFDKIGRKFYYPDETGEEEVHVRPSIVEPPLFTAFPEFNDIILTPYLGMAYSSHNDSHSEPGIMH